MVDLIDRQAAINTAQVMYERCDGDIEGYRDLMVESLKVLPSVQPEIIRCKDCKYYTPVTARCEVRGKGLYLIRGLEDYCSRAERREDGRSNQQRGCD